MRNVSLLIKPASSKCNLKCRYCFYNDVSEHRMCQSFGKMTQDTAYNIIEKVFEFISEGTITFAFQGGEPTLVGLEFYQMFIDKVNQMKKNHTIYYVIQTNGTLLNEAWFEFLKENKFLVGISIDGFESNHNQFRFTFNNEFVFKKIMENLAMLKKYDIEFNVLTVLTKQLANNSEALFNFYQENNIEFVQIIPCLPQFDGENDMALTPQLFSKFYIKFYDLWVKALKNGQYISVVLFDNILRIYSNQYPTTCGMLGNCSMQMVVESNGNVYPCDFYAMDEYLCGNLNYDSITKILKSIFLKKFLNEEKPKSKQCIHCRFSSICNGNCKRLSSVLFNENYCGYKEFLEYSFDSMQSIIKKYLN